MFLPLVAVGGYLIHHKVQLDKKKKQDQMAANQFDMDEDERRRRIVWSNQTSTEDDPGDGLEKFGKGSLAVTNTDMTPATTMTDLSDMSQPVTPYLNTYALGK